MGCRSSKDEAVPPPRLQVDRRVFAGSSLTGPVDAAPAVAPEMVTRVSMQWVALQQPADSILSPIDAQSRLSVALQSDSPLLASGRLTRPVRFEKGPAAEFAAALTAGKYGPYSLVGEQSGTAVSGATLQFSAMPDGAENLAALRISPQMGPAANTRGETANVAVIIGKQGGSTLSDFEMAVVDAVPTGDGAGFVVALPLTIEGSPWKSIAGFATVNAGAEPDAATALQADLKRSADDARTSQQRSPLGDGPAIRSALAAMSRDGSRRPALLLLTGMHSAKIADDFVLIADDARLQKFADDCRKFASADALPPRADWQWFLDNWAMKSMIADAEAATLPSELKSVLALHAGDAARRPDAIADILKQVGNPEALEQRLIAENLIALEDASPSARVRAFEWLSTHGKAPPGFDPLADARTRRAAIDKALSSNGGQP